MMIRQAAEVRSVLRQSGFRWGATPLYYPTRMRAQCCVNEPLAMVLGNNMGISLLSCIHSYGPSNPTAHSEGHAFQQAGPQS